MKKTRRIKKKNKINTLKKIKQQILPLFKQYDVAKAGIFGSFARGENRKTSDIDILVEFKGKKSLLVLAALEIDVERKLGRKADVLTYNSIHPLLKEKILKEEVGIL